MKDRGFEPHEVGSIYVAPGDRFVVSLIVGYGEEVSTPEEAALAALELTRDTGSHGTGWHVFDRQEGVMHFLEQERFDRRSC